jgi:hypothetical protein
VDHAGWLRDELIKLDPGFAELDLISVEAVLSGRRRSPEQTLADILTLEGNVEALGLGGYDSEKIRKQLVRDRQGKAKRRAK